MLRPYVLAALVASLAALLGLWGWAELRGARAQTALAELARDHAQQQSAMAAEIQRLQDEAVQLEREAAQELAALSARHAQETRDAQAITDRTLADLRSGTLRLRQRLAAAHCDTVPGAAAGADGGDAAGGTGLRPEDADFLVRESARADSVVRRLTLCQDTIRQYQALAGPRP
jgi:hypothetical protein